MSKKKVLAIAFALGLLIALSIPTTVSASTTYHVYEGQSIQAAVNAASPGGTVIVHAGVYHQSVVIHTNDITLQGESGTILKAEVGSSPLWILSSRPSNLRSLISITR